MFDIDKVRAIMSRYPRIHPEDTYALDAYWKDLSDALLADVDGTIRYLTAEATAEDLRRISEVTDELVAGTQSPALVTAIREAYCRFPETRKDRLLFSNLNLSIRMALDDAEDAKRLLAWHPPVG